MCKYNNNKFWDLTFVEGINKYSLRKLSANELAAVFSLKSDNVATSSIKCHKTENIQRNVIFLFYNKVCYKKV